MGNFDLADEVEEEEIPVIPKMAKSKSVPHTPRRSPQ
jgi:hypothetical protein